MATGIQKNLLLILAICSSLGLWGRLDGNEPQRRAGIIFGGEFEGFEVSGDLPGARTTRMAAFYEWDYGVRPFTKKTWEEKGWTWEKFYPVAKKLADEIAETVEPQIVRDHRNVALYAIIAGEDPFLTSTILSSKLYDKVREILGDHLLAVLIERNRFYLFPATGGTLEDFGPSIVGEYLRSRLPVSLEILRMDGRNLSVVGILDRALTTPELPPVDKDTEKRN